MARSHSWSWSGSSFIIFVLFARTLRYPGPRRRLVRSLARERVSCELDACLSGTGDPAPDAVSN